MLVLPTTKGFIMRAAHNHNARIAAMAILGFAAKIMLGAAASSAEATSKPRVAPTVVKVTATPKK
jgi:hypothetical protein